MADMIEGERIAEERIAEAARTGQDWLDLGGLALTKLPDALSKLTKLKRLSLGDFCQVTAEGVNDRVRPTERSSFSDISALSGLIALQELYLENTRCDDLSPIAKLQHLQRLSCPGTKVSDLSHITGLHQLQQLDCSSTQVSDLTPIKGLLQLQSLECSGTEVSDLTAIEGLWQLQQLDFSAAEVIDLSPIAGLQQLQHLDCRITKVSDLTPIAGLLQLQRLDCFGTQVSNLTPIAGLLELQRLDCGSTNISDLTPIKGLLQLQHLYCSSTQVSDLTPIKNLLQLQHLDCNDTKVSDLTPIKGLLQLKGLFCSRTKVSDLTLITGLLQLQYLDCSGTKVSDLTPIKGLLQLQHLDCRGTKVSDLSPIAKLQALYHLDCSMTAVGDLSPIAKIINLTRVKANNCSVASLPSAIKNLQMLQFLDLRENQIRTLPRDQGELTNLESFSMFLSSEAGPSGLWLEGNPLEDPLPELIAPGQPQATINVLRWLRGEPIETEAKEPDPPAPAETADDPPAIPEQGAGPRVVLDQTWRLVFAKPSDLDAKGNDHNRLEALHPALREAAADLAQALQNHPSNLRNERLLQRAEAYRALVDLPLDEVNFARLYGAGMQLLNAAGATRRALEAGRVDVPDLTPAQDECLANIENLHPPFVLASRDGQEMLADQTTIKLTAEAVEGIKEAGTELGTELINHPDLADREVGATIRDAAAEIGQGENEARDAVNTVSTMRNAVIMLTTASKWAITGALVGFAAGGPPGAVAAGGATVLWYGTKVVEKTKAFQADVDRAAKALDAEADKLSILRDRMEGHQRLLLKVEPKLRKITQLPGFTWLAASLDWLKRKSPPDKKE